MPPANALTYLKFALITVALIGGFVLVGIGKLDAATMYQQSATLIAALVVALGLTSVGVAATNALQAHTRAMVAMSEAPDQVRRIPTAPSGTRGFARLGLIAVLSLCALVFFALVAACGGALPAVPPGVANTGVCVIDTVSKDVLAGESLEVAVADAASKCFGAASDANKDQVRALWSSHLAAEAREHGDAGNGQ